MEKPLISFEEYEFFCKTGRPYEGYVWTKEGKIYCVEENLVTVVQPKPAPPLKSYGDSHRIVFFDVIKHPEISLVNLGTNDVLYNMAGDFVSVIEAKDSVKGEIKILKSQINFSLPFSWSEEQRKEYEIVDLKDITLSAEAYSKIFTHILSFEMKDKLEKVRNKAVAVEMRRDGKPKFAYLAEREKGGGKAHAYFRQEGRILAAVIMNSNTHLYETLWNVINMLGAHELSAHGETGWWNDDNRTHHLAYLFQMGHPSWKNTTPEFKKEMEDNLNSYYKDYKGEESEYKEFYEKQRLLGIYPKSGISSSDSIKFNERLSREFQEKLNMGNPYDPNRRYGK